MSCAGGSVVVPPGEPGEASGDGPEEGESGGPSGGEGRRGGSESGRAEAAAAAGDKPETRSVCSSESGSGSHPGGAGPICKICFQGPEQVRRREEKRARRASGFPPQPRRAQRQPDRPTHPLRPDRPQPRSRGRQAAGSGQGWAAGTDQHRGQGSGAARPAEERREWAVCCRGRRGGRGTGEPRLPSEVVVTDGRGKALGKVGGLLALSDIFLPSRSLALRRIGGLKRCEFLRFLLGCRMRVLAYR